MVSTVLVLLLTVCVEIISPSASYPGVCSPITTRRCSTFGPNTSNCPVSTVVGSPP